MVMFSLPVIMSAGIAMSGASLVLASFGRPIDPPMRRRLVARLLVIAAAIGTVFASSVVLSLLRFDAILVSMASYVIWVQATLPRLERLTVEGRSGWLMSGAVVALALGVLWQLV